MVSHGLVVPTRGVVLGTDSSSDRVDAIQSDVLEFSRRAEAAGVEGIWVGDSVLAKPRLEPLTTLAGIATITDSVTLGTAVYLPPLRHPINIAHLTATVDNLSNGRLALGMGVGIGEDVAGEYGQMGRPYNRRGAMLDEILDILDALWSGDECSFSGEFYQFESAGVGFPPVRSPPIYIASAAFDPAEGFPPQISDRLISHGQGWMPIAISPDTYAQGLDTIHRLAQGAGRELEEFDPAFYMDIVIADTEQEGIEEARRFLERYYPAWGSLSDDAVRRRGVFGPPAEILEAIDAYEEAGVETLITRFAASDQQSQLSSYIDMIES